MVWSVIESWRSPFSISGLRSYLLKIRDAEYSKGSRFLEWKAAEECKRIGSLLHEFQVNIHWYSRNGCLVYRWYCIFNDAWSTCVNELYSANFFKCPVVSHFISDHIREHDIFAFAYNQADCVLSVPYSCCYRIRAILRPSSVVYVQRLYSSDEYIVILRVWYTQLHWQL